MDDSLADALTAVVRTPPESDAAEGRALAKGGGQTSLPMESGYPMAKLDLGLVRNCGAGRANRQAAERAGRRPSKKAIGLSLADNAQADNERDVIRR